MPNEKILDCNHCGVTGKCICDECLQTANKNSLNLQKGDTARCSSCEGIGKIDTLERESTRRMNSGPSLTITYAQEEGLTKRKEISDRKFIAFSAISVGCLIIALGICFSINTALLTLGSNIIFTSIGAYFGYQIPKKEQKA